MLINQVDNAFPFSSFIPFYTNGLGIKNNATTPNTQLDIAAGTCLDSTGTFQLSSNASITINAANNGLNGLDQGTFAQATVYAVFLVADPVSLQTTGAMISTNLVTPLLPFGYSAYALIGYAVTIGNAAHFLPAYWTDNDSNNRVCTFDAPQSIPLAASGAATSYAAGATSLVHLVPAVNNLQVSLAYSFIPGNAAGDTLKFQGGASTGDQVTITGQVTTVHVTGNCTVLSQLVTGVPTINYEVTNAGDTAAASVAGFTFHL